MYYTLPPQAEDRKWNMRCPKCGNSIVWTVGLQSGATSTARCSQSLYASRIIMNLKDLKICPWEGTAVRLKEGSVRIRKADGSWLLERKQ